jgi:hypothetical protein
MEVTLKPFLVGLLLGAVCITQATPPKQPASPPEPKPTLISMEGENLAMYAISIRLGDQTGATFDVAKELIDKKLDMKVSNLPFKDFLAATAYACNGKWRRTSKGYVLEPNPAASATSPSERLARIQKSYQDIADRLRDKPITDTPQGYALRNFLDAIDQAQTRSSQDLTGWQIQAQNGRIVATSPTGEQEYYSFR